MRVIIQPNLFLERIDVLFGKQKKLSSKDLRIATNKSCQAVIFQYQDRALGVDAKILSEGDAVVDAESVRKTFDLLSRISEVEIFTKSRQVVIKQLNFSVKLNRIDTLSEAETKNALIIHKYEMLMKEKRRLQAQIARIEEQLVFCRIVRERKNL